MFLRPPAVCPAMIWYHWERGSRNYKRFYLFIYLFFQPFFRAVALFPRLTNLLELIEYDPLTAVWNNEASFPHIFSPRMASFFCTSVHIKGPYQCGIWGWRNYWSHWEPDPPYLLLLHWGNGGFMEPKAVVSVRRQWLENTVYGVFWCVFFSLNSNGTYYDVISCKYVWLFDYKIAQTQLIISFHLKPVY